MSETTAAAPGGVTAAGSVGWIGTGRMGAAMASRLARAGVDLHVWNRTRSKAEPLAELGDAPVAELDRLGEVVPRVDVHEREREAARAEGLFGQPEEDDRVLAAGEEQHGPLELGRDLAHDVDRLRLERVEMREADE